ncbi:alpha-1,2-fucosyltransferase [Paenibacillus sp. GYB004]|uniref:alpha-1,2-fucosyltransferase n=1 Tax=Paenibacillus sp. GYB004 TaxID=2994393 RepID=UPI002F96B267
MKKRAGRSGSGREIAMSSLGRNGRFGNQLFQYAFLNLYAKRYGLQVRTPAWIGQTLFGVRDMPVGRTYPVVDEKLIPWKERLLTSVAPPYAGVDFWGYFQLHTSHYAPYRDYIRSLYTPVPPVEERLASSVDKLRALGNTIVGLHIRRGDYVSRQDHEIYGKLHYLAPASWYKVWLDAVWSGLDRPVLFVASDDPAAADEFREYNPVTSGSLAAALPEAGFYPDFYILSQCDVLAISNSTFSYMASMLNRGGVSYMRPDLIAQRLLPYDPWNSPVNPWLYLIGY